jgi:hypothetical protein
MDKKPIEMPISLISITYTTETKRVFVKLWRPYDRQKIWKPQRVHGWLLIVTDFLLSALMAGLAYCMANPVPWDGPGKLGAVALFFPLHLLVFTLVAAILAFLAKRSGARLAVWVFCLAAVLTVAMELAKCLMWSIGCHLPCAG